MRPSDASAASRRRSPTFWLGLVASLGIGAALAWLIVAVTVLPASPGPAVGAPAPDFALRNHDGSLVRLTDFRGAPLLLVFYRGHW